MHLMVRGKIIFVQKCFPTVIQITEVCFGGSLNILYIYIREWLFNMPGGESGPENIFEGLIVFLTFKRGGGEVFLHVANQNFQDHPAY